MRILYQFPLSHFCEKARWLLDHKELEYVAQNLTPGVHRAFAQLKTGQNKLPILRDGQQWIADSSHIALYLDQYYPEHALLYSTEKLKNQILQIDERAAELGKHVRRWGLAHMVASDESMDILIGEKGYLRRFEKYSKPILKTLLSKGYELEPEKVSTAQAQMDLIIEEFNQQLIENHGRYLVGQRLSLEDISVCSMLAPVLQLPGTPWEKESNEEWSEAFQQYRDHLLDLPLGQYIQRIYRTERNSRVDWRGV